jgi:uncharacterized membrane protein
VLAAVDVEAITLAGAFIVGIVLGGIGTIRVMRWVLEYARRDQRGSDDT